MSKRVDVEWTHVMKTAYEMLETEYNCLWDEVDDNPMRDELLWRLERAMDGLCGVRYTV